jgi:DNA-binding transcriptional ArsR family regulator
MKDGPNIAKVAALIGDPARAEMLTALMTDRALTATELSEIAGVTKQTVSSHLSKLLDAQLVAVEAQGRHRYFRLANRDVALLLELLMGVAFRSGAVRLKSSPREPALRKARVCYDHLAGELAVQAFESMMKHKLIAEKTDGLQLTARGEKHFEQIGIDVPSLFAHRRALCRGCLDWGERRLHLAGSAGSALLDRLHTFRLAKRLKDSRVVQFTTDGERQFREWFSL